MTLAERPFSPTPDRQITVSASLASTIALLASVLGLIAFVLAFEPLVAALCGLALQLTIAVVAIRRGDPSASWVDLRFIYVGMYGLYNSFYPISLLMGMEPSLSSRSAAVTTLWIGSSALFGFTLAHIIRPNRVGMMSFWQSARIARPAVIPGVLLFGVFFMWYQLRGAGVNATTVAERRQSVDMLYTQTFVVSGYLLSAAICTSVFLMHRLPRLIRYVVVVVSGSYLFLLFRYGFRLQTLPVLLAFFILFRRRPALARMTPILAILVGTGLLFMGFIRENGSGGPTLMALAANTEFSFPAQTLAFYVEHPKKLHWGYTYLHAPVLFIPRAIYPEKGITLAQQFLVDAFGTAKFQGYTFTFNTEAFLNFSYAGPFCLQLIAWIAINSAVRKRPPIPIWYLCLSLLAGEVNRSDFGAACYAVAFMWLGCVGLLRLSGTSLGPVLSGREEPIRSE
jgi:hypothetical protein